MDFDFLDRRLLNVTRDAVAQFKNVVEGTRPNGEKLGSLYKRIRPYEHTRILGSEFVVSVVDGSGEFPVFQQEDVLLHFSIAGGAAYRTDSHCHHKLSSLHALHPISKHYVLLFNSNRVVIKNYKSYLQALTGLVLEDLVDAYDYCQVFDRFSRQKLNASQVTWERAQSPYFGPKMIKCGDI